MSLENFIHLYKCVALTVIAASLVFIAWKIGSGKLEGTINGGSIRVSGGEVEVSNSYSPLRVNVER
jgi:hypothetical protein